MKSPRTRAELVSAFQAVANSGKPYRLTVTADEAALVARALRLLFSQQGTTVVVEMTGRKETA